MAATCGAVLKHDLPVQNVIDADREAGRQLVRDDRMGERLAENCLSDVCVE